MYGVHGVSCPFFSIEIYALEWATAVRSQVACLETVAKTFFSSFFDSLKCACNDLIQIRFEFDVMFYIFVTDRNHRLGRHNCRQSLRQFTDIRHGTEPVTQWRNDPLSYGSQIGVHQPDAQEILVLRICGKKNTEVVLIALKLQ